MTAIARIRATPVTVPLEAPLLHSNGAHWGRFVRTLVEVETDDEGEANKFKLLVDEARPIAVVRAEFTRKVVLKLTVDQLTNERILRLKQIVADHGGPCTMELTVVSDSFGAQIVFGDKFQVRADEELVHALERLFGDKVAELRGAD